MPGYSVRFLQVAVAGGDALDIRALSDKQQFSDPEGLAAAAGIGPALWPLFGQIWPSAQKLADLMQHWPVKQLRVLEIGCGLALGALVVHRRGGNVTASDHHPLVKTFLDANLLRNHLPRLPYHVGNWSCANPGLGRFDLIIGSDILYERDHPALLAQFIALHSSDAAEVLIVDPDRGHRSAFGQAMFTLGYSVSETPLLAPLADGSPYHGRLLHYRRSARVAATAPCRCLPH